MISTLRFIERLTRKISGFHYRLFHATNHMAYKIQKQIAKWEK